MQNQITRRRLFKIFAGLVLAGYRYIFAEQKTTNKQKLKNKYMGAIKNIISLPQSGSWPTTDPFLFCVHHADKYPKANSDFGPNASLADRNIGNDFSNKNGWSMYHGDIVPGFPRHPHRGFETLTVVDEGIIDHADSLGALARYGDGDAQWLTAGDGINHSEMFPLFNKESQNKIDFFQIWINLPSNKKRVAPHFQMFWENQIPKISHKDKNGVVSTVDVIAGNYIGNKGPQPPSESWANNIENNVAVWIIRLKEYGEFQIPTTTSETARTIYLAENCEIEINNMTLKKNIAVELHPEKKVIIKNMGFDTKILLLQGKPIQESIVQYGPFVMNTKDEIEQAFRDYRKTEFGGWKWGNSGPNHGSWNGKFARLINGEIIKPT